MILPKPPVMDPTQLAAFLQQQQQQQQQLQQQQEKTQTRTRKSTAGVKRALEDKKEEDGSAEDDKRRRNTAASARFRIKKKMREQAMEHTVKEMAAKSEALQSRVNELELEIKWLRNLLIEKNMHIPPPTTSSS